MSYYISGVGVIVQALARARSRLLLLLGFCFAASVGFLLWAEPGHAAPAADPGTSIAAHLVRDVSETVRSTIGTVPTSGNVENVTRLDNVARTATDRPAPVDTSALRNVPDIQPAAFVRQVVAAVPVRAPVVRTVERVEGLVGALAAPASAAPNAPAPATAKISAPDRPTGITNPRIGRYLPTGSRPATASRAAHGRPVAGSVERANSTRYADPPMPVAPHLPIDPPAIPASASGTGQTGAAGGPQRSCAPVGTPGLYPEAAIAASVGRDRPMTRSIRPDAHPG